MIIRSKFATALVVALGTGLGIAVSGPAAGAPDPAPADNVIGMPLPRLDYAKPARQAKKGEFKGRPAHSGQFVTQAKPACGTPSSGCYFYAGEQQTDADGMTTDGGVVELLIGNPYKPSTEAHTLAEIAVEDSSGRQIVEVGWTRDAITYADANPRLFVSRWVNGGFGGYNSGGWVNAVDCSPCAGGDISAAVGTSRSFAIQHFGAPTSAWWVAYDNRWLGAFPDSVWASPTFTKGAFVQAFGEVASTVTSKPCTDMGTGVFSRGNAATATGFDLVNGNVAAGWNVTIQTDAAAYTVTQTSETAMRFGGPGWNSVGTATGATGSCAPASPGTCATTLCAWGEECPDGNGVTGCTLTDSWSANTPIGTCVPVNDGAGLEWNAYKNTSTTGKRWLALRTAGCTGASMPMEAGTQGVWPAGWNGTAIHAIKRTG
jgi:hypothetical protein